MWREGAGQIRNVENKEEILCLAREKVVDGVGRDMYLMVWGEVE